MEWDVTFDPVFAAEAKAFARAVQLEIAALAGLLRQFGPQLRRPYCDTLNGSKHPNMKELRVRSRGKPYRICFAFDPSQTGILLIGGIKSGKNWTQQMVATADKIYDAYLTELKKEGLL